MLRASGLNEVRCTALLDHVAWKLRKSNLAMPRAERRATLVTSESNRRSYRLVRGIRGWASGRRAWSWRRGLYSPAVY